MNQTADCGLPMTETKPETEPDDTRHSTLETNKIYQGDSLEVLKSFPDESVNCIMTSPPYWALRDYEVDGQLGLEPTFDEYIMKLCNIFDEVKRVLKKDGTCWVNIGDSYSGSGDSSKNPDWENNRLEQFKPPSKDNIKYTLESKNLCNIPARFSIEMQNRGWVLRNEIIWFKPNCMPASVDDRFTVDFEKLFFFVKSRKYYFEQQFEPMKSESKDIYEYRFWQSGKMCDDRHHPGGASDTPGYKNFNDGNRNKRAVWTITTKPFSGEHFAVYPEELCETPIKAGCPKGGIVLDPFFGAGTTGIAALKQDKKFIGIELNPEYIQIAEKRLKPYLEQTKLDFRWGAGNVLCD
jgi:DNA modification methylase